MPALISPPRAWCCLGLMVVLSSCSAPPHREFTDGASARPDAVAAVEAAGGAPRVKEAANVDDLEPWLQQLAQRRRLPGVAALVLRGDEVVAVGAAGERRLGSAEPLTRHDQFHIASCAKAISATLAARLVAEGYLEWDQPVTRYLGETDVHPDWRGVTLRHLLTHTSGLKDPALAYLTSTYFDQGSLSEKRAAFVRRLVTAGLPNDQPAEFRYCNANYILLAAAAEAATGQPWEQLMRCYVFDALQLPSAGYGPPGSPGSLEQPWGHGKVRVLQLGLIGRRAFDPGSRGADYPAMASPAGYVHLTMTDWARFALLHLRAHPSNPNHQIEFLPEPVFETLHQPAHGAHYAGGWFVETRPWAKGARPHDVGRVLFHAGDNGRWTSAAWLAPEIDLAILIVCNRGDRAAAVDEAAGYLVGRYARRR